ncbi:hypothetical protein C5167_006946 [Papaver somniferum]|uniref:Uncharacterized protein n=1 Tax=Papaver somniferum TaxID=3469 RepID=A0A4Y7JHY5_PAPSO|nr:hypothetical protein C5167_006946 [Papaver somniferum]
MGWTKVGIVWCDIGICPRSG